MNKTELMKLLVSINPTDIPAIKADINTLQVNKAEKTYVDSKFEQANSAFKVKGRVDSVNLLPNPVTDETISVGDIYLVGTENSDNKDEYVLLFDRTWEKLGSAIAVDLSDYLTINEIIDRINNAVAGKADVDENGKVLKAIDADTVNGLKVESAVPVGAVFTDTVYNDTEIREAIASMGTSDIAITTVSINDTMFIEYIEDGVTLHEASIDNTFNTTSLVCTLRVNNKDEFCDIEVTSEKIKIITLSPVIGTLYVIS